MATTVTPLDWAPRGCAVCDATDGRVLYPQRFAMMSEGSLFAGYDVVSCEACGHCYADRIPPQSVFDRYYREMSKYEGTTPAASAPAVSAFDRVRFARSVRLVERVAPQRDAFIFEIGCATGVLLGQLQGVGYTNLSGLDPSPECARMARASFNLPVRAGTLSDDLSDLPPVDVLILIGVLEHLRDLDTALITCRTLIAPGGHLLIAVPDASRYPEGDDAPFQEFSVEHVNFFGPQSLVNLMARYGFRAVAMEQSLQRCDPVTITPVLHTMFERVEPDATQQWTADETTVRALERYVQACSLDDQRVRERLAPYVLDRQPIIVWGAGTHTLRLLATGVLNTANVRAVVDSNPRYHGKTIRGIPIIAPTDIDGQSTPIVVSSRPAQRAIRRYIAKVMRLQNEVVVLYDLPERQHPVDPTPGT